MNAASVYSPSTAHAILVPSSSHPDQTYHVTLAPTPRCDCPDQTYRSLRDPGHRCKHMRDAALPRCANCRTDAAGPSGYCAHCLPSLLEYGLLVETDATIAQVLADEEGYEWHEAPHCHCLDCGTVYCYSDATLTTRLFCPACASRHVTSAA